ncbi:DUF2092 domain-containing protein [Adhaeribacter sp. BT258]|uniref:DUF2092 domain-containing protein n=1 Tax=Adhaeribacter terrigena TaxID=2793070 RepID=A0ABS1C013_9BACT|nr:DUF2092 domain-containing protein [Adhaeribacter terrigena]MBK0402502.1 DUF2092 domain-containing protein [Adhaeribacter terrigena]
MYHSNSKENGTARWLIFSLILFGVLSISWKILSALPEKPETTILLSTKNQTPKIDKQADQILKQMSDYLTSLDQFSYNSKGSFEEVLKDNKKHQTSYNSEVYVDRPNKLRVNAASGEKAASVYYDGSQFTVMGKKINMYAQASAPPTLDQALDAARDKLQLDPPGADLIYTNPYTGLLEEIIEGKFKGDEKINGISCYRLAFKSKEVDWDIWIEKGDKPLPRKYEIISKNMPEKPAFLVEFSDWNVKPTLNNEMFAFVPPADSRKVDFVQAKEMKDAKKNSK